MSDWVLCRFSPVLGRAWELFKQSPRDRKIPSAPVTGERFLYCSTGVNGRKSSLETERHVGCFHSIIVIEGESKKIR